MVATGKNFGQQLFFLFFNNCDAGDL